MAYLQFVRRKRALFLVVAITASVLAVSEACFLAPALCRHAAWDSPVTEFYKGMVVQRPLYDGVRQVALLAPVAVACWLSLAAARGGRRAALADHNRPDIRRTFRQN